MNKCQKEIENIKHQHHLSPHQYEFTKMRHVTQFKAHETTATNKTRIPRTFQ